MLETERSRRLRVEQKSVYERTQRKPLKRMPDEGKGKCYMRPSKGDGVVDVDIARIGGCPPIMYVSALNLCFQQKFI